MAQPGGPYTERTYTFYRELSVAGIVYAEVAFTTDDEVVSTAFISKGILVANDGAGAVDFAFRRDSTSAVVLAGRIDGSEVLTFDHRREGRIFVKLRVAGPATPLRVWAW